MDKEKVIEVAKLNQLKYVFDDTLDNAKINELKTIGIGNFIDGANWMREQLTQSEVTKISDKVWSEKYEECLDDTIDIYSCYYGEGSCFENWLKSLKQRLGE